MSGKHLLHTPKVQSIGVYTINQLARLWICVLGRSCESLVFLVETMEDDVRATSDVVLAQIVQIFILLIQYGEVVWKVLEYVLKDESGNADAVFKHINTSVLVKLKHFVDGFQHGFYVFVIIQHKEIVHVLHVVLFQHGQAQLVVLPKLKIITGSSFTCRSSCCSILKR